MAAWLGRCLGLGGSGAAGSSSIAVAPKVVPEPLLGQQQAHGVAGDGAAAGEAVELKVLTGKAAVVGETWPSPQQGPGETRSAAGWAPGKAGGMPSSATAGAVAGPRGLSPSGCSYTGEERHGETSACLRLVVWGLRVLAGTGVCQAGGARELD